MITRAHLQLDFQTVNVSCVQFLIKKSLDLLWLIIFFYKICLDLCYVFCLVYRVSLLWLAYTVCENIIYILNKASV